jgi:FlaA1/EpsC-like NDP-sugar epimerase
MASTTLRNSIDGLGQAEGPEHHADLPSRSATGGSALRRELVALDSIALVLAWGWLPLVAGESGRVAPAVVALLMISSSLALLAWQRLYRARICAVRSFEIVRLGRVTAVLLVLAALVGEADPWPAASAPLLVGLVLLAFGLLVVERGLFSSWLRVSRTEGRHVRSVALVGFNEEARALSHLLGDDPQLGYRIAGVLCDRKDRPDDLVMPWLGQLSDAIPALEAAGISGVILVLSGLDAEARNRLLRDLLAAGIHVQVTVGL